MAGFTFNGCGASDSYYPIKFIEERHCKICSARTSFSLMELRMKIKVFFIPTVTVNTKYAIVCEKCKNGFYISEEQKNGVMDNSLIPIIADDGINFEERVASTSAETYEIVTEKREPVIESINSEASCSWKRPEPESRMEEPVKEYHTEYKPVETSSVNEANNDSAPSEGRSRIVVKVCNECKRFYTSNKDVCPLCNKKLEIRK